LEKAEVFRLSTVRPDGGEALVFRVIPTKAFGHGRGERFSATRRRL
jgi:hypothetical protein